MVNRPRFDAVPFESGRKMLIMPKRIPEETKQRAIRLVLDHLDEYPNLTTACESVAKRLAFGSESLRRWVRLTELAQRTGITIANLSALKNNRGKAIRFTYLTAIRDALEVEPARLFALAPR